MSPDLSKFELKGDELKVDDIAPRYWRLHALYESPLVIAAHLSRDLAELPWSDDARESLLTWLSKIEQAARFVNGARPVVACLQVEDKANLERVARWENEANWRGSGYVLYAEESKDEVEARLERLLFKPVDEAHLDSGKFSVLDRVAETFKDLSNAASLALMKGLHDVLARPSQPSQIRPGERLKERVAALVREWKLSPNAKPDVAASDLVQSSNVKQPLGDEPASSVNTPDKRARLNRVIKVQVSCFRGWGEAPGLNIDADLVLLTGPNGYGKSTLLESLVLGICGYISREGKGVYPRWTGDGDLGVAHVRIVSERGDSISAKLPPQNSEDKPEPVGIPLIPSLPRSNLWHDLYSASDDAAEASRTEARLCSVFSDQLHERFNYATNADTLLRALSIAGARLGTVREALETAKKDIDNEIQDLEARIARIRESKAVARAELSKAFEAARPVYRTFMDLHAAYESGVDLPEWPDLPDSETERLSAVQAALNELARALGVDIGTLSKTIRTMIESWKVKAPDAQQSHQLEKLRRQSEDLKARYPEAHFRVEAFDGADGDPPLDLCLHSLARNLGSWRQASLRFGLHATAEQLGRVIPDDLQRLSNFMSQNVTHWRSVVLEMERLEKKIEDEKERFRETERFRKLRAVEESRELLALWALLKDGEIFESSDELVHQLENRKQRVDEASQALDEVIDKLEPLRLHSALREEFQKVLNDILGRIQLSPGILPMRVDSDGHVFTCDGRTISDLSTGQRTQLAVALSVGINLALSSHLGSGVLIMDDVTAAYDVSNIAREAAFWRATAYGHLARSDSDVDRQRRQVFLSSHNESMTRRLIELLRPPKGATMKVVRFTNWSPISGPEYRVANVQCTAASCLESRQRLTRELAHTLGRNR